MKATAYHVSQLPAWTAELSEQGRAALEGAYIYNRPIIHEDGRVERPFWDLEPPPFPPTP